MNNDLQIGSVYFHKNYIFEDGTVRDKFLICVGYAPNRKPLICLTTSKQWHFQEKGAFLSTDFLFIKANRYLFKKDTWVVFKDVKIFNGCSSNLKYKGNLRNENIKTIQKGILNSKDVPQLIKEGLKNQVKGLDISQLAEKFHIKK